MKLQLLAAATLVLVTGLAAPAAAGTTPTPGHGGGHGGAAPGLSATPDPTSTHTAPRAPLQRSRERFTDPGMLAAAALVRLETVAEVQISLHHGNIVELPYTLRDLDQGVASGVYVYGRNLVVTSRGALHDSDRMEDRFAIAAINQAFADHKLMRRVPDGAEFRQTRITAANNVSSPPEDAAKLDGFLQSCYRWRQQQAQRHCSVSVQLQTVVHPSVTGAAARDGVGGFMLYDAQVATIVTEPTETTPVALQIANPAPGERYWLLASDGANRPPSRFEGTFTDDDRPTLPAEELRALFEELGPRGDGAPIVSESGDLVAILGMLKDGSGFEVVDGSHLVDDVRRKFGLREGSSPTDADFRDGLQRFEDARFADALPKLEEVAEATGGQRVVLDLVAAADAKDGTSEDVSDEDLPLAGFTGDDGAASTLVWITLAAALLLGALAVAVVVRRRRRGGAPDAPEAVGTPAADAADSADSAEDVGTAERPDPARRPSGETATRSRPQPAAAAPAAGTPTTLLARDDEPGAAADRPAAGGFCRSCGAQLSPGDRFCYSCGTPAARS